MKQFIRYLLLIVCVLSFTVWMLSISFSLILTYRGNPSGKMILESGNVLILHELFIIKDYEFQSQINYNARRNLNLHNLGVDQWFTTGTGYDKGQVSLRVFQIPVWMFFAPLFLLTLKLWYRPIKNWWQGKSKQGFAVELVDNQDESAKSA